MGIMIPKTNKKISFSEFPSGVHAFDFAVDENLLDWELRLISDSYIEREDAIFL